MRWFERAYYWGGFSLCIYGFLGLVLPIPKVLDVPWGLSTVMAGLLLMMIGIYGFKTTKPSVKETKQQ